MYFLEENFCKDNSQGSFGKFPSWFNLSDGDDELECTTDYDPSLSWLTLASAATKWSARNSGKRNPRDAKRSEPYGSSSLENRTVTEEYVAKAIMVGLAEDDPVAWKKNALLGPKSDGHGDVLVYYAGQSPWPRIIAGFSEVQPSLVKKVIRNRLNMSVTNGKWLDGAYHIIIRPLIVGGSKLLNRSITRDCCDTESISCTDESPSPESLSTDSFCITVGAAAESVQLLRANIDTVRSIAKDFPLTCGFNGKEYHNLSRNSLDAPFTTILFIDCSIPFCVQVESSSSAGLLTTIPLLFTDIKPTYLVSGKWCSDLSDDILPEACYFGPKLMGGMKIPTLADCRNVLNTTDSVSVSFNLGGRRIKYQLESSVTVGLLKDLVANLYAIPSDKGLPSGYFIIDGKAFTFTEPLKYVSLHEFSNIEVMLSIIGGKGKGGNPVHKRKTQSNTAKRNRPGIKGSGAYFSPELGKQIKGAVKSALHSGSGLVGSYLGGKVGMAAQGRKLAQNAASRLSDRILGKGSYGTEAPAMLPATANSLWPGGRGDPYASFTSGKSDGEIVITHQEYFDSIICPSNTPGLTIWSQPINPGLDSFGPYISQIASNYEGWLPEGLVWESRSSVTPYSAAASLGTVILSGEYNAFAPAPTTVQSLLGTGYAIEARSDKDIIFGWECEGPSQGFYYVRSSNTTQPINLTDAGTFYYAFNNPGNYLTGTEISRLFVTYRMRLMRPKLSSQRYGYMHGDWAGSGTVCALNNTNTFYGMTVYGTFTGVEYNAGNFTFPNATPGDQYQFTQIINTTSGTGITGGSNPSISPVAGFIPQAVYNNHSATSAVAATNATSIVTTLLQVSPNLTALPSIGVSGVTSTISTPFTIAFFGVNLGNYPLSAL
jgi:hypothetical protein